MKQPRTLFWLVETSGGEQIRGQRDNAVCSLNQYSSILWRKFAKQDVKRVTVSIDPDATL